MGASRNLSRALQLAFAAAVARRFLVIGHRGNNSVRPTRVIERVHLHPLSVTWCHAATRLKVIVIRSSSQSRIEVVVGDGIPAARTSSIEFWVPPFFHTPCTLSPPLRVDRCPDFPAPIASVGMWSNNLQGNVLTPRSRSAYNLWGYFRRG